MVYVYLMSNLVLLFPYPTINRLSHRVHIICVILIGYVLYYPVYLKLCTSEVYLLLRILDLLNVNWHFVPASLRLSLALIIKKYNPEIVITILETG